MGDTTTNSILGLLNETHLNSLFKVELHSAVYSGREVIQLDIYFNNKEDNKVASVDSEDSIVVLRRVQDSYINVSQLFDILLKTRHFSETQKNSFFKSEIIDNPQYMSVEGSTPLYNDLTDHENVMLRGLWIPYDRAVSLALKFDIYELAKRLFLLDVHDFEGLPRVNNSKKRVSEKQEEENFLDSPSKKQKVLQDSKQREVDNLNRIVESASESNSNAPFTLQPLDTSMLDAELVSDIKQKFGEIFKKNEEKEMSSIEINDMFSLIDNKKRSLPYFADISLDSQGKSALHFAATLGSLNLASAFVGLELCSPIRGTLQGESPLISTISVTNSIEQGNFTELLSTVLWPNLWLLDNRHRSFLHFLTSQAQKKFDSSKYFMTKILEWLGSNRTGKFQNSLENLSKTLINQQEEDSGNTCLHIAAEVESMWFIRVFLELKADINVANKTGVKPKDLDIVKAAVEERDRKNYGMHSTNNKDSYLFELIKTNLEISEKKNEYGITVGDTKGDLAKKQISSAGLGDGSTSASSKLFRSILDLLENTNKEYSNLIVSKREQMKDLNRSLLDATIVTANNRYTAKKIPEKLTQLDNLKLQMTNITNRINSLQKEVEERNPDQILTDDVIDLDKSHIIEPIYSRIRNNESLEDLKSSKEFLESLPSVKVLKKQVKAYEELNQKIESQLSNLSQYSELTSKFKKVVSFCTGVEINEVDELLDGLLEAVEGQV